MLGGHRETVIDTPPSPPTYEGDAEHWRRLLRKPLFWLFLVFTIGGPVACGAFSVASRSWTEESEAYVREAIPAICGSWDAQEFARRSTNELLKGMTAQKRLDYFAMFARKLGPAKTVSAPIGGPAFNFGSGGLQVWAHYDIEVDFERGKGVVRVTLWKRGGQWSIAGFFVNSDALVP